MEDRAKPNPYFESGYCIYDTKLCKPYIWRSWPTEFEALLELRSLLKPYSACAEWRARLKLARYTGAAIAVSTGAPPKLPRARFQMC